ncbi:hypothetical protein CMUS01_07562 [Colletotrichum musicola]|uniref:Uncharacterized protein n=1 Tax=Colletotrichum musicola TaxID=2175873 RepID=A0A8H6KG95_9PEZI|nr:hypothetical protein CMUS01_07562 [Colletotrichum musicola]
MRGPNPRLELHQLPWLGRENSLTITINHVSDPQRIRREGRRVDTRKCSFLVQELMRPQATAPLDCIEAMSLSDGGPLTAQTGSFSERNLRLGIDNDTPRSHSTLSRRCVCMSGCLSDSRSSYPGRSRNVDVCFMQALTAKSRFCNRMESLGRGWTAWPPEYEPAEQLDARQGTVASLRWLPAWHHTQRPHAGRPTAYGPRGHLGIDSEDRRGRSKVGFPWNETTIPSAGYASSRPRDRRPSVYE